MKKARYFIYRNLHKQCFSVRYKGKVIAHMASLLAYNVEFVVHEKGRQKVLAEKKKNVHAFIVAESVCHAGELEKALAGSEIYYNPYRQSTFTCKEWPVNSAEKVICHNNKIYSVRSV